MSLGVGCKEVERHFTFVVRVAGLDVHPLGPLAKVGLHLQGGRGVRSPRGLALHRVVEPKAGSLAVGLSRQPPGMRDPGLGEFPTQTFAQGEFCRQGFAGPVEPPPQRGNGRLELEVHRRHRQMALAVGR